MPHVDRGKALFDQIRPYCQTHQRHSSMSAHLQLPVAQLRCAAKDAHRLPFLQLTVPASTQHPGVAQRSETCSTTVPCQECGGPCLLPGSKASAWAQQQPRSSAHWTWKRTTTSLGSGCRRGTRQPLAVQRLRHTTRAKALRASTREGCPSSVHTSSTSTAGSGAQHEVVCVCGCFCLYLCHQHLH
jgi:hypothetical protein